MRAKKLFSFHAFRDSRSKKKNSLKHVRAKKRNCTRSLRFLFRRKE